MADSQTMLLYGVYTQPYPLQVSTAGESMSGEICIKVTAPTGKDVYCKEIDLYIPVNVLSKTNTFTPGCTSSNWTAVVGSDLEGGYANIKFITKDSRYNLINYPLSLTIEINDVVETPGIINNFQIIEYSSNDEENYAQKQGSFSVQISQPVFYLKNFAASSTAGGPACGQFGKGVPINLTWDGNADNYIVRTQSDDNPIYKVNGKSVELSEGLINTTTFVLQAEMLDSLKQQTDYLYQYLTVSISNPDITPSSSAVSGTETVKDLDVTGTVVGDLNISGKISGIGMCPPYSIIMYSGATSGYFNEDKDKENNKDYGKGIDGTPCEGWQICNGNNGTPDLTDRFVVGAGVVQVNSFGGPDNHIHTTNISINVNDKDDENNDIRIEHDGDHVHNPPAAWYNNIARSDSGGVTVVDRDSQDVKTAVTSTNGDHGHAITAKPLISQNPQPSDGSTSYLNRPMYYALYYIMRLPS